MPSSDPEVYYKGQKARFTGSFTNASGLPVDPTSVTFKTRDPNGTVESHVADHDGVGTYHHDVTLNQSGDWYWRWEATGTVDAVTEGAVKVLLSNF